MVLVEDVEDLVGGPSRLRPRVPRRGELEPLLCNLGFAVLRKFSGGVQGLEQERVVLLYVLQKT